MPRKAQPGSLGSQIRQYRLAAGLSQRQLAALAGYKSASILSQIECGINAPGREKLVVLASALGCTVADLWVEAEGQPEQHQTSMTLATAGLSPRCRKEMAECLRFLLASLEDESHPPPRKPRRKDKGPHRGTEEVHSAAS